MKKVFFRLGQEIQSWIEEVFKKIPGRTGNLLRRFYWKPRFARCSDSVQISTDITITSSRTISIGENVFIMPQTKLYANDGGEIKIGNNVSINTNVQLGAANSGRIIIGNNVLIGPNVVLRASNHLYDNVDIPIYDQGHSGGIIAIEDDVWIGANVVVLPDTTIKKGAIVAAGTVVTKNVESYHIVAGVPAQTLKIRK